MNRLNLALIALCLMALAGLAPAAFAQIDLLPDLTWEPEAMLDWELDTAAIPGSIVLRFTGSIPNIGLGEFRLVSTGVDSGDGRELVDQRIFRSDGSFSDRPTNGFFYDPNEANPLHRMQGVGWTSYRLRAVLDGGGVGAILAEGAKEAICLQSSRPFDDTLPNIPDQPQVGCFGEQGISVGYTDLYSKVLTPQWVPLPEGFTNGDYWLEVEVDTLDYIVESDETNNVARILIMIDSPLLDDRVEPPPMVNFQVFLGILFAFLFAWFFNLFPG